MPTETRKLWTMTSHDGKYPDKDRDPRARTRHGNLVDHVPCNSSLVRLAKWKLVEESLSGEEGVGGRADKGNEGQGVTGATVKAACR